MASAKKLPSGSWRARVFYKDTSGKECCESFTAETKKEAEFLAAQFRAFRKEQTDSKLTFQMASERYIDSKRSVVSPTTIRGYKTIVSKYLDDILPLKVTDITQEAVQIAINKLAAKGYSSKTCHNAHGFISAVLGV